MSQIISKAEIVKRQRDYIWKSVGTYYKEPLVLERGDGMRVFDVDGRSYLDCFGGVLTVSVGHCNQAVTKAVMDQVQQLVHISTLYVNKPQTELAERVARLAPGDLSKSFFSNSGTEADETALILARLYTGRQEIVALRHCYSGRTALAMSVAGHASWRLGGSYVAGIKHAHAPYCYRCPFRLEYPSCDLQCARDVEELIQTTTSGQIAAFIAEPIMGVGGFITPPPGYFEVVVDIIRRYGGLFISDEVQTGWGRTGDKWFGIEHWDVTPDIITGAKGMANGHPIGWTIARPEVADGYPTTHVATFGGNPVSTTAANATIGFIEDNNLPHNAAVVGGYLRERLEELKAKYPVVGDVRGTGLMQALELVGENKSPNPQAVLQVFEGTKERGVLIGKGGLHGNVIRLGPPLIASTSDIDELVAALDASLATV